MVETRIWKDEMKTPRGRPICSVLTPRVLSRLYGKDGKSLEDIARLFGCSRMYVMKLARKYGIPLRGKREARYLALKADKLPGKHRKVNHNFFSVWTKEMAYVLGYFCADGNLHRDKRTKGWRVSFSSNDRAHLETIRRVMKSTHGFVVQERQPRLARLDIGSEKLALDLLALGVTPRKSLTLTFPRVPQGYLSDFIRGYFDGDGSIYQEKHGRAVRFKITSGSKKFLDELDKHLRGHLPSVRGKLYSSSTARCHDLRYSRAHDILQIFDFLYPEGQETLHLERKYHKFQEAMICLAEKKLICKRQGKTSVWRPMTKSGWRPMTKIEKIRPRNSESEKSDKMDRIEHKIRELQEFVRLHPGYEQWVAGRVKELERMKKGKGLL